MNSYTYILFVKVWSNEINSITNYGNIDAVIKCKIEEYTNKKQILNIKWDFTRLTELDKCILPNSYIASISFHNVNVNDNDNNQIILDSLKNMFNYIENELKDEGKIDHNSEIIYNVMLPIKM